jgi:excisionase family DNA binding protein
VREQAAASTPSGDLIVGAAVLGVLADALADLARTRGRLAPELDVIRAVAGQLHVARARTRAEALQVRSRAVRVDLPPRQREALGPRVFGTGEVARRLDVSAQHVRRLLSAGQLRGELVGGRWLIEIDAVEERKQHLGHQP